MEIQAPIDEFKDNLNKYGKQVFRHFDHKSTSHIKNRVLVWHRRARKTTLAINLLIREAFRFKNESFAYIAPTFKQAKRIVWRDPKMLKRYIPKGSLKKPFNETELIAEFLQGSVLHIGGADDPDRWRGMGCKGWVLDEYAMMRNGKMLYEEIILPIIRANGGWILFIYTPKGRNHGWELFKKANESEKWGCWFLPVDKSGILSDETIAEIKTEMTADRFNQEFMCAFLEGGGGVIKRVRECVTGSLQGPVRGSRYVMGVDLAKKLDWTVLTVINRETRHLVAFERFQKIDWSFQKEKIARLAKEYYNPLIVLDSTGVGNPIEDDLKRMGLSVRGYQFTQKSKKELVEKLIITVTDRHITFPDIESLVDELEDYDIDERGRYNAPPGLHDDCVISLALAVEGLGAEIYTNTVSDEELYIPYSERFQRD